jgi:hypothetical protein
VAGLDDAAAALEAQAPSHSGASPPAPAGVVLFHTHPSGAPPAARASCSPGVYGGAGDVEIRHQAALVGTHPRATPERIVLDPSHYEGEATAWVLPPAPLERMGRRLVELAALVPEQRPLDLNAALAEVAR